MDDYDETFPFDENDQLPSFETVMDDLFTAETVRIPLLYRLSDMADDEMAQFQREWLGADLDRRVAIVKHMAELAENNYIVDFGPAFAFMFADPDPEIRQAALEGVWDSTDTTLIAPIVKMLQTDDSHVVRASAARALAHYILLTEWGQLNQRYTNTAVAALLATLDDPNSTDDVRRAALEAVAAADEPGVMRHIQDAYESGSTDFRLSALFAMGNSADSQWLPIVLEELTSPDPDMRAEAARAAGTIGDESAVTELMAMCADEELEVAEAAVLALGQIGGDEAQQFLNQMAADEDYTELHDAIELALEEVDWGLGELDLLAIEDIDDLLEADDYDDDDEIVA